MSSGRVGRTRKLTVDERAVLSVRAYIRARELKARAGHKSGCRAPLSARGGGSWILRSQTPPPDSLNRPAFVAVDSARGIFAG